MSDTNAVYQPDGKGGFEEVIYDGETPCTVCGVIICGYCQGKEETCKGGHHDHHAEAEE